MAPIPTIQKKKPQQPQPTVISTDDVYDEAGNTLTYLLGKSNMKETQDTKKVTSKIEDQATVKDIKPVGTTMQARFTSVSAGRKYRLTFSDISWFTTGSQVVIGYFLSGSDTMTTIETITQDLETTVMFELPADVLIDSVVVIVTGTDAVRLYLDDVSDTEKAVRADVEQDFDDNEKQQARENISAMVDLTVSGVSLTQQQIENVLSALGLSNVLTDISNLDDRVTALEQANT